MTALDAHPSPDEAAPEPPSGAFAWLFGFVRPHRARLVVVLLLSTLASALVLAQPWLTKSLIDDGLLARDTGTLYRVAALMLAAGLAATLVAGVNRYAHVRLSGLVLFDLRAAVYRHLQRLSPAWFARARGGDLLQRLDGDVAEVQRFAVDSILASVNALLALAGSITLMLLLSWELFLIAAVVLPLELVFLRYMRPLVEVGTRRLRERASDLSAFLVETLGAMKTVQALAGERREAGRLDRLGGLYLGDLLRLQVIEFSTAAVPGLMTAASRVAVMVIGGLWFIAGRMELGAIIAFASYLAMAVGPVQTLLGIFVGLRRMKVSLTRVQELTRAAPAVTPPAEPRPLPAGAAGALAVEGVSFRYPGGDGAVLDGVDVAVPPGSRLGIVGASGAGKTTLVDLLQRHYDPTAGRVRLDGVDLRDLDPAELRRRIAVVAQEVVLFRASYADNIRYGRPEASDTEVRAAAERARIADFIAAQPGGYDAEVGERGAGLSGGQRQRLALARALLQDPLVLVLDEATAALDADTEATVLAEVDELFAGRTRILVSHRRAPLEGCDRVLEIDAEGRARLVGPAPGETAG